MSSAQAIEQVMPERAIGARVEPNPRRPKRGSYTPQAETLSLLKVSGNAINGLGGNDRAPGIAVLLASADPASL